MRVKKLSPKLNLAFHSETDLSHPSKDFERETVSKRSTEMHFLLIDSTSNVIQTEKRILVVTVDQQTIANQQEKKKRSYSTLR